MKHITFAALFAGAFLAMSPPAASADPVQGFYMSGGLALGRQQDQDINGITTPFGPQPGGYISSGLNSGINLAAGWGFGNGFRAELELSHRRASFDRATAGALRDATTNGQLRQTGVFVNGYYDFNDQNMGALTPYIGAGIGGLQVSWTDADSYNAAELVRHDDSDTVTAAQLMVGASYPIAPGRSTALTVELRHTRLLSDLDFDGRVLKSRFGSFPIETSVTDRGRTEIVLGLRHQF